tara:strand:+ start:45 stop:323 length:279 start_codon:yes stop_codon:yes gene_type:complete
MRNKLTIKQLRKLILEEADIIINYDRAEDLEPREDAWSGGENLSLSIDISDAVHGLETVTSPETLSINSDQGVYRMSESNLRSLLREIIKAR